MNTLPITTQPPQNKNINRPQLLVLLRTGLAQEAYRFSKQIALSWLAYYPGDLLVSRLFAQVQIQSGSYKQASRILNDLIKVDPENVQNLELLILTSQASGLELSEEIIGSAYALGVDFGVEVPIPRWAKHLRCACLALAQQEYPKAEEFIHKALIAESLPELVGVTHLEIVVQKKFPNSAIRDLAEHYNKRWPTCIPCSLIYAKALLDGSESEKAVALIHQASVSDGIPESLRSIQEELLHVADRLKQNYLARADGRFPVYIVFTTRNGLENQYGSQLINLDNSLQALVSAIRKRSDWGAELVYADDPKNMGRFGLQPAKFDDPWELKLALADIDTALAKRGEMIGAVLIIGGPEIVPFHKLPNPVDDNDDDVPSDNPYATRDENYFIPEWLIGRVPGGSQKDIEPIQEIISNITERHTKIAETQ